MPISISGSGTITGISAGGLPDGIVQPADLSTGAPSWTSGGELSFNSGYGSVATAYGCRAWVNFNGTTASPSTIRGSGNVSSVTKNGTGDYTINFTTAMADANYAVTACNGYSSITAADASRSVNTVSYATGSVRVVSTRNAVANDIEFMNLAIFR